MGMRIGKKRCFMVEGHLSCEHKMHHWSVEKDEAGTMMASGQKVEARREAGEQGCLERQDWG